MTYHGFWGEREMSAAGLGHCQRECVVIKANHQKTYSTASDFHKENVAENRRLVVLGAAKVDFLRRGHVVRDPAILTAARRRAGKAPSGAME